MATISIDLPDRAYDGLAEAARRNNLPLPDLAREILSREGLSYSNQFGIGVLTSAGFVARFTPAEYGVIIQATATDEAVAALVAQLTAEPYVALDDPRLAPGLALLVARGLLADDRPAALLSYLRP